MRTGRGCRQWKVLVEPEEIEQTTFPISKRGYDPESVHQFLAVVAAHYREAVQSPPAPPPPPPPPSYAEKLGDQVAAIVDYAAQTAEELRARTEREVHALHTAAAEEAAETTQLAMRQLEMANQVTLAAKQEADAIRAAARYDANRLEQEARETAARVEQDAHERAAQLERAASTNVSSVLAEARVRYEQLRAVQQKSVERLAAVETMVRRAREEATGEEDASEVLGVENLLDADGEQESSGRAARARATSPKGGDGSGSESSAGEAGRRSGPLRVERNTKGGARRGRAPA